MESVQDDTPECDRCLELQAEVADKPLLCSKCERQILPQLKEPSWTRLIGFTNPEPETEPEPSAPAQKAIRRNQRRFNTKNTEDGLTCHFCVEGCGTPVNGRGLVCGPCGEDVRARRGSTRNRVHYSGIKGQAA